MFDIMVKKQEEIETLKKKNKTLLEILNRVYRCSGEKGYLDKSLLDDIVKEVK